MAPYLISLSRLHLSHKNCLSGKTCQLPVCVFQAHLDKTIVSFEYSNETIYIQIIILYKICMILIRSFKLISGIKIHSILNYLDQQKNLFVCSLTSLHL